VPSPEVEAAKEAIAQAAVGGPFSFKALIPTFYIIGISAVSGALSFHQKVKAGRAKWANITEFVGEIFTSMFVGLGTFWICKGFEVNEWLSAAAVAVTAHMGARAIFLAEQWIERKVNK
jgi:hypothetical protein